MSERNTHLVIVESPTKARTISRFLSKNFVVTSCMGHVRDLPHSAKEVPAKYKKEKWANLGVNIEAGFTPIYCVSPKKQKVVQELKTALKKAQTLYLATDEDREGESISWHLLEVLKPKVPVHRMVFHEITKTAIDNALEHTRALDTNLVRAQEARRILDRLVGYGISPVLWKKIAYGLSAGRVQSVAVRLLAEREEERMRFQSATYASLQAHLHKEDIPFTARLHSYREQTVALGKDFNPNTGKLHEKAKNKVWHMGLKDAQELIQKLGKAPLLVTSVEEKPLTRRPSPPFITSTLQQDASRKWGWPARQTMKVAQTLYEQGHITYMRTDSVQISSEAMMAVRKVIQKLYGKTYLPEKPRHFSSKKPKGAQEAHEAIRPAGTQFLKGEELPLKGDTLKLYNLIWKRTLSSQMADSKQKQTRAQLCENKKNEKGEPKPQLVFVSSGLTIEFAGFLKVYVEGLDSPLAEKDREGQLPQLKVGELIPVQKFQAGEHHTKPPARYTEAALIQTMEKEGIGRPSTYAPTISTIMDRGYVQKTGTSLVPTFTALIVSHLLKEYFPQYVDLDFTSQMEDSLDQIAEGSLDWVQYLDSIYLGKDGLLAQIQEKEEVIQPDQARRLQLNDFMKGFEFRVGRYGAYVCRKEVDGEVCASIPENQPPADVTEQLVSEWIEQKQRGSDSLGNDPDSGRAVYQLTGRYGPYVQLGEVNDEEEKPKRVGIPQQMQGASLTLEQALFLLSFPRLLGAHPETEKPVRMGNGRFGPYVVHDGDFRSIPKDQALMGVDLEWALALLAQPKKGRGGVRILKELGEHPKTGKKVSLCDGRFGPYVRCGTTNVSVPEGVNPEHVKPEEALLWLSQKSPTKTSKKKTVAKKKTTTSASSTKRKKKRV